MKVIIPASGAVPPEMISDFGDGLGALLSIAGKPSLTHILDRLPRDADLVVTLDEGDETVAHLLRAWPGDVVTVLASARDTLGQVLHAGLCEAITTWGDVPVHVVLSDTLTDFPIPSDTVGVQAQEDSFRYTTATVTGGVMDFEPVNTTKSSDQVCVGIFHVSSAELMRDELANAQFQWYDALHRYGRSRALAAHPVDEWIDLGHLPSYYRARRGVYVSRSFNSLRLTARNTVIKSSEQKDKIQAEIAWYQTLPDDLATFTPRFLASREEGDSNRSSYELEYVPLPTIAEQLVWGRMTPDYWVQLFAVLDTFLPALWRHSGPVPPAAIVEAATHHIYVDKTRARVHAFLESAVGHTFRKPFVLNGVEWDDLSVVTARATARAKEDNLVSAARWTFIHGDLFPGNMFLDRRTERILTIDPRGSFGVPGPFGDPLYDLAKLSHSFLGGYDFIIAGLHSAELDGQALRLRSVAPPSAVQRTFRHHVEKYLTELGLPITSLRLAEALLFLSMLPLHDDDDQRQLALLGRGLEALAASGVGR